MSFNIVTLKSPLSFRFWRFRFKNYNIDYTVFISLFYRNEFNFESERYSTWTFLTNGPYRIVHLVFSTKNEMRNIFISHNRISCQNKCTIWPNKLINAWLRVVKWKFSRTCSLPWRKRHQVWPWWQRQLGRGGWCWNTCYILSFPGIPWVWHQGHPWISDDFIKISDTYSPVITTSGDWTQIFAIFLFLEFKILIDWSSELGYIPRLWWSSICWFTKINHGFITFNRGSSAELV